MATSAIESVAGVLLLFFLPGFAVSRALFPEWRFSGALGLIRIVETLALSITTSVAITIVVGFGLLVSPGGFSASWSDPSLELWLALITVAALALAAVRGAFSRRVPAPSPLEPSSGEEGAWELIRRMEDLARRERRLTHAIRRAPGDEVKRLERELESVRSERESIVHARESEYAQ